MPEAVAMSKEFSRIETYQLESIAVGSARQGARKTAYAVLLELKRRGAMTTFGRVMSNLSTDDRTFFESLLRTQTF